MLEAEKDALDVDCHHLVEHLLGVIDQGPDLALPAGVVHQNINPTPGTERLGHISLYILRLTHVGHRRLGHSTSRPQLRQSRIGHLLAAVDRQHLGTEFCQQQ